MSQGFQLNNIQETNFIDNSGVMETTTKIRNNVKEIKLGKHV